MLHRIFKDPSRTWTVAIYCNGEDEVILTTRHKLEELKVADRISKSNFDRGDESFIRAAVRSLEVDAKRFFEVKGIQAVRVA